MESLMSNGYGKRKILVVEDEPSIRNVIKSLVEGAGCDGDLASGAQALARIHRNEYDAVLLDLRCSAIPAQEFIAHIQNIQPNLVGRVLVVTADVPDAKTLEVMGKNFLIPIPGSRLRIDLPGILNVLLGRGQSPSRAAQSPRIQ